MPTAVTPPPWGLLGAIAWGALGMCAWFAVQFAVIILVIVWRDTAAPGSVDMQRMAHDGFLLAVVTVTAAPAWVIVSRSEEHTSELQSRGLISYAVFCLKKK